MVGVLTVVSGRGPALHLGVRCLPSQVGLSAWSGLILLSAFGDFAFGEAIDLEEEGPDALNAASRRPRWLGPEQAYQRSMVDSSEYSNSSADAIA
ncbi:hypothetical protein, partial [Luteitalea sp.]|uniref:hypothetical protein n=1 Tax=Luteitalea sp. TaxID=2004800 RepID=UPI0037C9A1CC